VSIFLVHLCNAEDAVAVFTIFVYLFVRLFLVNSKTDGPIFFKQGISEEQDFLNVFRTLFRQDMTSDSCAVTLNLCRANTANCGVVNSPRPHLLFMFGSCHVLSVAIS
jgi:hypothetical protein